MDNNLTISRILVLFSLVGIISPINDGWDLCEKIASTGIHIQDKGIMLHILQDFAFLGIIWLFWKVLKQNEARLLIEAKRIAENNAKESERIQQTQDNDKRRMLLMQEMMKTYMLIIQDFAHLNAEQHKKTENFVKESFTQFAQTLNSSILFNSLTGKIKIEFGEKETPKTDSPILASLLADKMQNLQTEIEKLS